MKKSLKIFILTSICIFCFLSVCGAINNTSSVIAYSEEQYSYYLGGQPIGITMSTKGLIITGINPVITQNGECIPLEGCDIKIGDSLYKINGVNIKTAADIARVLAASTGNVSINILRNEASFVYNIEPAIDVLSGLKKLGLTVKEEVTGVGTLTFVRSDGFFGALGHAVADGETGIKDELQCGKIYSADIIGVVKGERGKAGELRGVFDRFDKSVGKITSNSDFGVSGEFFGNTEGYKKVEIAEPSEVLTGKAHIYTTINGSEPSFYQIDILKISGSDGPATQKNIVISVTDKRLLAQTGGIVQGMSGSPIVQNGKLIGAVTHVFINEPTKGYGLFVTNMIDEKVSES